MSELTIQQAANPYAASKHRPVRVLAWGIVLLALLAGLAALIRMDPARPFSFGLDKWWAYLVGNGVQDGFPGWVFEHMGGPGAIVVTLLVIVPLLVVRHWRSAIVVLAASIGAAALTELALKPFVDRPRPFQVLSDLSTPTGVNLHSFPSGHATSVAAIAICLIAIVSRHNRRWIWVISVLLMAGIAWQRTMCNAHWLTDVLAGLMAGAGFALLIWYAAFPAIYRDFEQGAERRAEKAAFLPQA